MRVNIYEDHAAAKVQLRSGETDVAIVGHTESVGSTVYLLGADTAPPASLTRLPGYRSLGIAGIPAEAVKDYTVDVSAAEVAAALE